MNTFGLFDMKMGFTSSSKNHEGEASLPRKQQKHFSVVYALDLVFLTEVLWEYALVYLCSVAGSG